VEPAKTAIAASCAEIQAAGISMVRLVVDEGAPNFTRHTWAWYASDGAGCYLNCDSGACP
jgi:hypothetical protein